jgi:hypothetical protein
MYRDGINIKKPTSTKPRPVFAIRLNPAAEETTMGKTKIRSRVENVIIFSVFIILSLMKKE